MLIHMMRRRIVRTVTSATFWFIIIVFLTLIWHVVKHRSNLKSTVFRLFTGTTPYVLNKAKTVGKQPTNRYNNSMKQNRLIEVKINFNDLSLTNEATYPANRIGNYIFSNPNLCKDVPSINFIIIVHTATTHFERRQRIRATFANTSLFYPAQIRAAFLLGKTNDSKLMEKLWLEHRIYNDSVMGDFIDDYYNLTLKGVMGLRWVKDHCSNAAFVLKIDDDVLINMFTLVHSFLPEMKTKKRTIFCQAYLKDTMPIFRAGPWKVDSHIFPNRTTYPYPYCPGFTVILTPDLIDELYQTAKVTPFFWIDDNYLFGLLPYVIGNIYFSYYECKAFLSPFDQNTEDCALPRKVGSPLYSILLNDIHFWPCWYSMESLYNKGI